MLANLSDSNATIGKADYRRLLCASQSAKTIAASVFASAGLGESTTDLAWDGQSLIYENGEMLAESERFLDDSHMIFADIDLERLSHERMRQTTFGMSVQRHKDEAAKFQIVRFAIGHDRSLALPLVRKVERFHVTEAGRRALEE